jgi:GeoRSP system SPASM domain protein
MELALPITVYWDLASRMPFDDSLLNLCDEILECRPLMLQLYDPSPVFSEGMLAILDRFKGTPVAVSLTIPYSLLADGTIGSFSVKELLFACNDIDLLVRGIPKSETGIAFYVNRSNWRQLPAVIAFCRENSLVRLVLPMQRLYNGEEPFLLDSNEQRLLEKALIAVGGVAGIRLTIHDPFLWRAFNPGIPFPQGGCQAANTMIAISPDGGVYPCPTLPERLGTVGVASLKSIITSPAKRELRNKILKYPVECSRCLEIDVCRGGCRGRSYVKYKSFDGIDDACC